eukprot:GHVU01127870.1.p1 GENE.GHVU01127870.1~~GHVU01127870.1.p1  ORF type:complete len:165 (+),score=19.41 GHVU01127870.1:140-634(+)
MSDSIGDELAHLVSQVAISKLGEAVVVCSGKAVAKARKATKKGKSLRDNNGIYTGEVSEAGVPHGSGMKTWVTAGSCAPSWRLLVPHDFNHREGGAWSLPAVPPTPSALTPSLVLRAHPPPPSSSGHVYIFVLLFSFFSSLVSVTRSFIIMSGGGSIMLGSIGE